MYFAGMGETAVVLALSVCFCELIANSWTEKTPSQTHIMPSVKTGLPRETVNRAKKCLKIRISADCAFPSFSALERRVKGRRAEQKRKVRKCAASMFGDLEDPKVRKLEAMSQTFAPALSGLPSGHQN